MSHPSSSAQAKLPPGLTAPDPAPLGLLAFALGSLIQAFFNAGVDPDIFPATFPLEFFVGGVVQMIAGLFEFRQGSRLGATAFTLLGAFWVCFVVYVKFVLDSLPEAQVHSATGFFLLPWAIVLFVLTLASARTTLVLMAAFFTTTVTVSVLTAGQFTESTTLIRVGAVFGFITAALGMYGAFAGLVNGTWGRHIVPTFPDPGKRLQRFAANKGRPTSITSSTAEQLPSA
ncbi:acetate uptake transporter [Streptomyces fuscigenes]|uniref:acetate uptake transporter n=1 Tax=Streptomyces fuscigenes TaxID=1528880 RepID=UPI001F41A571|nr:acetate uptake transporter [Streptomyces fuscigenes]MCF3960870.1 acetate uptake transporter [Streptomyces fuscigenes]